MLVDTSIWIEFLRTKSSVNVGMEIFSQAVTTPVIIQEVFQGLKSSLKAENFKESFLSLPRVSDPTLLEDYLHASEIYSLARRKGLTIRSSVDCLIAAIAIKNRLQVWHKDRDFLYIAKITDLRIYKK